MKRLVFWLLTILGYLLYTVGVIVVLLWILFPADSVLVWLQGKLNTAYPSLSWNIDNVEAGFPLKLKLSDIRVNRENDPGNQLLHIPEMHFSPDIEELVKMKKQIPVHYQVKTLDGTVAGEIVPGKGSMVQCSGEIKNIQVGKLDEIWRKTNRNGSGKISGTFQYSGKWQNPLQGNLHADLKVSEGKISLQQQIFGLDQVNFNSMTTVLSLKDKIVTFEKGVVDSRLFNVSYTGTLKLTDTIYTSDITLTGFMEPRPELFGGLKNATAASFIKNQLQNDKLSFTISGSILEPGILFKGASGIIDGIIDGGLR